MGDAGGDQPPTDLRLHRRRSAQVATGGAAAVGTDNETLEQWLARLEGKIDRLMDLVPRVAVLEASLHSVQQAPAQFRAWSTWVVGIAVAGFGCFGCLGTIGTLVSATVGVVVLLRH